MEHCKTLKEYMLYVEKVRNYAKKMELQQAVERAVEECITEGILAGFLARRKAEVVRLKEKHFQLLILIPLKRIGGYR